VTQNRPALFRGRHFEDVVIILCVRWYLRYSLSYRDLEEIMAERGLWVRELLRLRIFLVHLRTRVKNRIHGTLARHYVVVPGADLFARHSLD
jgi:hypothetical protein